MIAMTLTIHPDSAALRQAFIRKFTMPWEEFQVTHKDWIDGLAAKNHTVTYGELYLWDLMDHRAISFATALDFLRSMSGEVYVTSERESNGGHHEFEIDGAEYTEVVIRGSAAELADLIEYEWYEPYRLDALGMYLTHNGVVRESAKVQVREGREEAPVTAMEFTCDREKAKTVVDDTYSLPGVYYVRVWLNEGRLSVGDDLMFVLVGSDTRPHGLNALDILLRRLKTECVEEKEIFE